MAAPERQAAVKAKALAREAVEYARLIAEGIMVPGEDRLAAEGPHKGHALHSHPSHVIREGGGISPFEMCSCGTAGMPWAVYFPAGEVEPEAEPGPCPVCAARGIGT
jgi:hypothetical protein